MSLEQRSDTTKQPSLLPDFGNHDFSGLNNYKSDLSGNLPKVEIVFTSNPSDSTDQNADSPPEESPDNDTKSGDKVNSQELAAVQADIAETLGKSWDWAYASRQYAEINQELETAIRSAYKDSGAKGVDELWQTINSNVEAPGRCPIILFDGDTVTVRHSEQVRSKSALPGKYKHPEHSNLGYLQDIEGSVQHSFDLSKPQKFDIVRPGDVGQKRQLDRKEQERVDQVMDQQFDKVKKNADRRELENAFRAVAVGDLEALSKMVCYAPDSLSTEAMETFEKALEQLGFQVETDGLAERSIDGGAFGSLILIPPGSDDGVRLSYNRPRGFEPKVGYRVEGVSVSKGAKGRLETDGHSNKPDLIRKRANQIAETFCRGDKE